MGIESDQLVFDYLSRVGDLAQQRQLPSGDRMRLVTELRGEIERRRARAVGDAPVTIRRILARLGTPDEVVSAAGSRAARDTQGGAGDPSADFGGSAGAGAETSRTRPAEAGPWSPGPSVPVQRTGDGRETTGRPKGLRRMVPRPRPADPGADDPDGGTDDVPSPPHLASTEELGPRGSEPDWWRVDGAPLGGTDMVTGFTGGVEIPEILRPPRPHDGQGPPGPRSPLPQGLKKTGPLPRAAGPAGPGDAPGTEAADGAQDPDLTAAGRPRRGLLRRLRRPAGERAGALRGRRLGGWSNPLLLIAAGLLLVGAFLGNLLVLGFGWVIAYASRRLTTNESKLAVLGLPGLAAAAGIVWLWGRAAGRWGDPVVQGHMSDAIGDTWPWVLRGAAVSSALFLVWRSQRRL